MSNFNQKIMKTIFIPITSGRGIRNCLRTDVLFFLKKMGYQPVILVQPEIKKGIETEFGPKGFIVESYQKPKSMEKKLLIFRHLETYSAATNFSVNTETNKIKRARFKKKKFLKYSIFRILNFLIYKFQFLRSFIRFLDWKLFPKKWCLMLFEKYQPVLVLSTDMITNYDEIYILEWAQKLKIPIVTWILSWDNLTGYGRIPIHVNKLIVWNEFMKKELIDFHGFKEKDVYIAGVPQYDIYFYYKKNEKSLTEEQFLKEIGASSNKKLITYTTAPVSFNVREDQIIEIIHNAIQQNKIFYPSRLLVRLHPKDEINRYRKFKEKKNIILDSPGKFDSALLDHWNPNQRDITHLIATLKYSDLIINIASTMTIEAALFDKPIINIAFNGYKEKCYLESVRRYYDYTHYSNIVKTGGVKIAKSPEELIFFINQYFKNPSLDKKERGKIVREQTWKFDGKASERVANYIREFLNNLK